MQEIMRPIHATANDTLREGRILSLKKEREEMNKRERANKTLAQCFHTTDSPALTIIHLWLLV
jgi:hypothetical protein